MTARALALLALLPLAAHAADMTDCATYANRGSAAALRQLLGMPFIDASAGRFLYRRAYSYCINSDEVPVMTFTREEQPIIDMIPMLKPRPRPDEPLPGSVPATDAADAPADVPVAPAAPAPKPKRVTATKSAGADQPLCASHNMRTVYNGRHWNCRK